MFVASINTNGLYGSIGECNLVGLGHGLRRQYCCQNCMFSPLKIAAKLNRFLRKPF